MKGRLHSYTSYCMRFHIVIFITLMEFAAGPLELFGWIGVHTLFLCLEMLLLG
jgi:hypothetical protein